MKYKPLKKYSDNEVLNLLANGTSEELKTLSMSVGEYQDDWKFAQDVCLKLLLIDDLEIRASAVLGLSYIARVHKRLDRKIVEPYIEKEIKNNIEFCDRITYAVEDIYLFLKWR